MRILHVTDVYLPRLGGIELHVRDLALQQSAAGHDVEVLTMTHGRGSVDIPRFPPVRRPAHSDWVRRAAFGWRAHRLARELDVDVVHAHVSTLSPLAYASLPDNHQIPTLVTVHSLWRRYIPIWRLCDSAVGWTRWPAVWSAVSRAAAEDVALAARGRFDVAVVPNGIDLRAWPLVERRRRTKELRVVSVMRLAARKRPLPLLRMLHALRGRLPSDVRLSAVIIGAGPQRQAMERYADSHGMSGWLQLPGHLPRPAVAEALADADVFVAPAKLESFGIAALEARATGLPVVGSIHSGLNDFIESGRDGLLVDDDAAMVDALAHIAEHPLDPHALMDVQHLQPMNWANVVDRTTDLYVAAGSVVPKAPRSTQVS
jgi:glycosyltransferase involved in cell wall biosynthesis